MKRVLCNAIVDPLPDGSFSVTVTGQGHHDGVMRVYTIKGADEDAAAKDGLSRFVEEIGDEP